jgi:hypothetical protein
MLKKIGLVILVAGVGFILGWISNMAYSGYTIARFMLILQDYELATQRQSAEDAYFHQSPEVAVWALEHFCTAVEKVIEQRGSVADSKAFVLLSPEYDLTFSHARLGKLYGQMGDAGKSQYHFDQAVLHAKAANLKAINTKEDCLKYLEAMDSKAQEKEIPSS